MFAAAAFALLCCASVTSSAPLPCEDLMRPLDQVDLETLSGRWVMVQATVKDPSYLERLNSRDSATISFVRDADGSSFSMRRVFSADERCEYSSSNISVRSDGFSFADYNISVSFLQSCLDCITMRFDSSSQEPLRMYMFSRRRQVDQNESEVFTAQGECLGMTASVVKDPSKELCPEEIARVQGQATEAPALSD